MYPVSLFVEQADNKTRHIKPSKKIFFIIIVPSSETLAVCGITLDALFIPQQKDKKILYAQTTSFLRKRQKINYQTTFSNQKIPS